MTSRNISPEGTASTAVFLLRKWGIGAQPHRKIAAPAASGQGARRKGGARPDRPVKKKKKKESGGGAARFLGWWP